MGTRKSIELVGVGMMIANNPLHGSGQAGFPHPALALGDDAHAAQGIGVTDGRRWQPAGDEAPPTIPEDGPNSSRRVFSGCSSRWNFLIRSVSSARN